MPRKRKLEADLKESEVELQTVKKTQKDIMPEGASDVRKCVSDSKVRKCVPDSKVIKGRSKKVKEITPNEEKESSAVKKRPKTDNIGNGIKMQGDNETQKRINKTKDNKARLKEEKTGSKKHTAEPVVKHLKSAPVKKDVESKKSQTKKSRDIVKAPVCPDEVRTPVVVLSDIKLEKKGERKRKIPIKDSESVKDGSTCKQDLVSVENAEKQKQKPGRKRKTKADTTSKDLIGITDDDTTVTKFVGAHVSIAEKPTFYQSGDVKHSSGLYKSVYEAKAIKAQAFAVFLRSTQRWECKPLMDDAAEKFKLTLLAEGFRPDMVLPHGSYLMNCGSPDDETLQKSRDVLIDDLQRCERLGLTLFNFHPGSTCGKISVEESLDRIAESINIAHSKTKYVIPVIENMSCQGSTVGGKFTELRGIIDRVKDKSRIGVCLDTCHAFAAGYDLSTEDGFQKMLTEFEDTVGFEYLKAMHINDSKGLLGCHKDRHENIGKGHIGKEGFQRVMNCPKFDRIPMILETPCPADNTYLKEIKLLNSFINKI